MKDEENRKPEDVALIIGTDEERKALKILRKRGERVEGGLVRAAEPGRPVMGDLVRLRPRPEFPILCDVETVYEFQRTPPGNEEAPPERGRGHRGPARVVTDAYRRGWERIFGRNDLARDPDVN